jgi:hypothetical protein
MARKIKVKSSKSKEVTLTSGEKFGSKSKEVPYTKAIARALRMGDIVEDVPVAKKVTTEGAK